MPKLVGVRFQRCCKIYDFDSSNLVLNPGELVVVETEHGLAMGEVATTPRPVDELPPPPPPRQSPSEEPGLGPGDEEFAGYKKVRRVANQEDLVQQEENRTLEAEGLAFCQERINARGIPMNLVRVECLFDRSKILFYFTAEGRLDFRELVRDLVGRFKTRIEMRQIGVRHEAKLLGGLGSCGRELCCATFLRDFEPVSVKMAKEQNLSLNPTKISGLCGRLMCCLTYEYETYREHKKGMPKLGKRLTLAGGTEAKVIRQNILERQLVILHSDGREEALTPEELQDLMAARPAARKKDEAPEQPAPEAPAPPAPAPAPEAAAAPENPDEAPDQAGPDGKGQGRKTGRPRRRRRKPKGNTSS